MKSRVRKAGGDVMGDPSRVSLRDVTESDIEIFFEHQSDPVATGMAAFPTRPKDAHVAHWHKVLADDTAIARTIVFEGQVAGNIGSWTQDGVSMVGYWIGRNFWGKGIATSALSRLLEEVRTRPLYAHVAVGNIASKRVLEKCNFTVVDRRKEEDGVEEEVLVLRE
jgi:RimJ/RimL family protein N-acetyltransferase